MTRNEFFFDKIGKLGFFYENKKKSAKVETELIRSSRKFCRDGHPESGFETLRQAVSQIIAEICDLCGYVRIKVHKLVTFVLQ